MVVITCDITVVVLVNLPLSMGKRIPGAGTAPIFPNRALDLVGGSCDTKNKISWE